MSGVQEVKVDFIIILRFYFCYEEENKTLLSPFSVLQLEPCKLDWQNADSQKKNKQKFVNICILHTRRSVAQRGG